MSQLNININPFIEGVIAKVNLALAGESPNTIARALEEVEDTKQIVLELTEGIVSKQLTPDFVVKRLKEIPENYITFFKSESVIAISKAYALAKDISYDALKFINDEIIANVKNVIDGNKDEE